MTNKTKILRGGIIILLLFSCISILAQKEEKDEWHYSNGSKIVCRVDSCGKTPEYSNWDDRFCKEHLNKSINHSDQYNNSIAKKKINTKKALTQEQAELLRGTGYRGTRPNSAAENNEIKAAMIQCKECGMHSDNGANSICDECRYNKEYGFD